MPFIGGLNIFRIRVKLICLISDVLWDLGLHPCLVPSKGLDLLILCLGMFPYQLIIRVKIGGSNC
jgi:hypothetical protein